MNAQEAIEQANEALIDYREAIAMRLSAWRPSKDIEAEIIVNGGVGDITIDGKNAEIREAQLRLARNLNLTWAAFDKDIRYADAAKEAALATMELCKAVLAYETALANERAALGAGTLQFSQDGRLLVSTRSETKLAGGAAPRTTKIQGEEE